MLVSGPWIAHLSAEGARILHVYADRTADFAADARELVAGWAEGRPRVDVTGDPSWGAVTPFLT